MTDTKFIDTVTGKLHLKLAKIHLANDERKHEMARQRQKETEQPLSP